MNDFSDMFMQGQTELVTNPLKCFHYICGIKFQKNGSNVQYTVDNFFKPMLSASTDPDFEVEKPH